MTSAAIRLEQVTKTFDGRIVAVDAVTLDIAAGEFFSLLGPSGCGKTTSLRMIAGFEHPDSGRIHVGGRDITDLDDANDVSVLLAEEHGHASLAGLIEGGLERPNRVVVEDPVVHDLLDALPLFGSDRAAM